MCTNFTHCYNASKQDSHLFVASRWISEIFEKNFFFLDLIE